METSNEVVELTAVIFSKSTPPRPLVETFLSTIQEIESSSQKHPPIPPSTEQLSPNVSSITFTPSTPITIIRAHDALSTFETTHNVTVVLQPSTLYRTPKRLAVFDMDSTLIQQEVIDLLAGQASLLHQSTPANDNNDETKPLDIGAAVAAITVRAMNGELDFSASLRERVALLKGLDGDVFTRLRPRISLAPGAKELIHFLRARGIKTALLSGGFLELANYVATDVLGIDEVHANQLEVVAGKLTGLLLEGAEVVDSNRKKEHLQRMAAELGITKDEVFAVGDGANDLPMLWAAGLGVAVHAKPRVQREAPCRLNPDSLIDVLFLLGYTAKDMVQG